MINCDRCGEKSHHSYQVDQTIGNHTLHYYIGSLCDNCRAEFTAHLLSARHNYIHRYFVEASNKMFRQCIDEFMIKGTE